MCVVSGRMVHRHFLPPYVSLSSKRSHLPGSPQGPLFSFKDRGQLERGVEVHSARCRCLQNKCHIIEVEIVVWSPIPTTCCPYLKMPSVIFPCQILNYDDNDAHPPKYQRATKNTSPPSLSTARVGPGWPPPSLRIDSQITHKHKTCV